MKEETRMSIVLFNADEIQFGKERFKVLGIFRNFILLGKTDIKRLNTGG
jgi:hypothetical protein